MSGISHITNGQNLANQSNVRGLNINSSQGNLITSGGQSRQFAEMQEREN